MVCLSHFGTDPETNTTVIKNGLADVEVNPVDGRLVLLCTILLYVIVVESIVGRGVRGCVRIHSYGDAVSHSIAAHPRDFGARDYWLLIRIPSWASHLGTLQDALLVILHRSIPSAFSNPRS